MIRRHRSRARLCIGWLIALALAAPIRAVDAQPKAQPETQPGARPDDRPASPELAPEGPDALPGTDGHKTLDRPASGTDGERSNPDPLPPWHEGVADADKRRAQALFEEGNALYENVFMVEAAERYQQAVKFWDHPAIQLNLARTLLYLQRPVEEYQTLQRAARYGPSPHDSSADYQLAKERLQRLESYLVVLDVRCSQPGVDISLDGQRLFSSPGVTVRHLAPGQHTLVAKKPGHLTESETLVMESGARKTVLFSLLPIAHTAVERRRWPVWKPWVLVGSAAALTAVGATLRWRASVNYAAFDRGVSEQCNDGCNPEDLAPGVAMLETRARWQNGIGIGALLLGGAGLIAGGALVFLNQPRTFRVSAESGVHIALRPSASGPADSGFSAYAWWRF